MSRFRKVFLSVSVISALLTGLLATPVHALTGNDFSAGNIISGAVFTNSSSMSVGDVQNFLNSKVNCDINGTISHSYYYNSSTGEVDNSNGGTYVTTTRAIYGQRYATWHNAHPSSSSYIANESLTQYVCLPQYVENPTTHQNNLENVSANVPGGISAAQIIINAAQAYTINPEVLLTTLQKEQGLVTDDWPWTNEYQTAMGYACPDTAACDSTYYGFANQVTSAAKQYRRYLNSPNSFNYVVGNNQIYYNVASSCSQTSNVNILNQSTAALYDYTPYQPDSAVLAHTNPTGSASGPGGSVAGDTCGAYGNRNFWWYFNTWFGSTQTTTPYAWLPASNISYTDSARTIPYSPAAAISIVPGGTAYVTFKARNNGNQSWSQTNVRLGASSPDDRTSIFADSSWLNASRISMQEATVAPGDNGTFMFDLAAPQTTGSYSECFNVVADGVTWMSGPPMCLPIDVVAPQAAVNTQNLELDSGQSLTTNNYLMSPSAHSTLNMQTDGNLVLYNDSVPQWYTSTGGSKANRLIMQTDGNLVLYDVANEALWFSGTGGNTNARAVMQDDGNLVVYSSSGTPLWQSMTSHVPSYDKTVLHSLTSSSLLPLQSLQTANRNRKLVLQTDGNFVLYSSGKPVWTTLTQGNANGQVIMQADGNLVVYDRNQHPLWFSGTNNNPGASLVLQDDGNLVIYSNGGVPIWQSHTLGK